MNLIQAGISSTAVSASRALTPPYLDDTLALNTSCAFYLILCFRLILLVSNPRSCSRASRTILPYANLRLVCLLLSHPLRTTRSGQTRDTVLVFYCSDSSPKDETARKIHVALIVRLTSTSVRPLLFPNDYSADSLSTIVFFKAWRQPRNDHTDSIVVTSKGVVVLPRSRHLRCLNLVCRRRQAHHPISKARMAHIILAPFTSHLNCHRQPSMMLRARHRPTTRHMLPARNTRIP